DRLPDSREILRASGVSLRIETVDTGDPHPNTYRLTLFSAREQHSLIAISTGGGMMEAIRVDGFPVSISGDYYETLLFGSGAGELARDQVAALVEADAVLLHQREGRFLLEIKAQEFLPPGFLKELVSTGSIESSRRIAPVLPVLSRRSTSVPFSSCRELLEFDTGRNLALWRHAIAYECARGGLTEAETVRKMGDIVQILRRSIAQGIAGTHYEDRVLGHQSGEFRALMEKQQLLDAGALNRMILYVTALMEVKSSMGVIVAMPTAGACAALPGAVIAMAEELGADEAAIARAFLAGGLIGVFIATAWTFAAEVGGCQAEGGSAAAMAAAALVTLAGGTLAQAVGAASMAMQSMIGLICDPIANRVEAPCLGKNVMAAANALCCANMALAGFDPVIPLDEVIETARRVAKQMPREVRCTALGGLSITPTSLAIERRLARNRCGASCGCV
ncbi:MAG: serine dehydratase, partial [Armatimonadetes bacterium]|nr:serine dehydratase [Armatimonadota bacterium]